MKTIRSWLVGLGIGASLFFSAHLAKGQAPIDSYHRAFTYQGILMNGNVPFTGTIQQMQFIYFDSAGVLSGNALFTEAHTDVQCSNGIFNIVLGDPSLTPDGFPETMLFDRQYEMKIVIDQSTTFPGQLLWSSAYSLNAERAGGISVSPVPVAGDLFPMPLDGNGKISSSMLPTISNSLIATPGIATISGVSPNGAGNVTLIGDTGITITTAPGGNQITISSQIVSAIAGIFGGKGLEMSGSSGVLDLNIAPGGITDSMLAPNLQIGNLGVGNGSKATAIVIAKASEANGSEALLVKGGISSGYGTDGTGLSSGSPQIMFADQVAVPAATGTSLQIYNKLIGTGSTIVIMPYGLTASVGELAITSQAAGTFTVSATSTMGTSGGGSVAALNYMVVNH